MKFSAVDPGYLPLAGAPGAGQLLLRNCCDHFWGCRPLPQPKGNSQETLGPCQQDEQLDPRSRAGFLVLGASCLGRSTLSMCYLPPGSLSICGGGAEVAPWGAGGSPRCPGSVGLHLIQSNPSNPLVHEVLSKKASPEKSLNSFRARGQPPALPADALVTFSFNILFLIER